MLSPAKLELLLPETQALIMEFISIPYTLKSLLQASPRFYQVFLSRREFHLSILARWQFCPQILPSAWDTVKASEIQQQSPLEDQQSHRNAIADFVKNCDEDMGPTELILSPKSSIPLIRLGRCIEWFVNDYAELALSHLSRLGELACFDQDSNAVHAALSRTEVGRLQRAFCRFETYVCLFGKGDLGVEEHTSVFLGDFDLDEIEELACVREYLMHRLWLVYDRIEDLFVSSNDTEIFRKALEAPEDSNWFNWQAKENHTEYMENTLLLGLPALQEIIRADSSQCVDTVLSHSVPPPVSIGQAFHHRGFVSIPGAERLKAVMAVEAGSRTKFHGDDLTESSIGWLWGEEYWPPRFAAESEKKGLRDWGYIFWDKERMNASGVLDHS